MTIHWQSSLSQHPRGATIALVSELITNAELRVTRGIACGGRVHNAEGRIFVGESREGEAWCVGEVKEIGMQFKLVFVHHSDVLREGDIKVVDAVGTNIRKIARCIARLLIAGISKASRIQEWLIGKGGPMYADAGEHLSASHIRPLVSIGKARVSHGDGHRLPCLERERGGALPPAHDSVRPTAHTTANQPATPERQLSNYRRYKSICRVVGTDRPLRL